MKNKFIRGLAAMALALGIIAILQPLTEKVRAADFKTICAEYGGYVSDDGAGRVCVREIK